MGLYQINFLMHHVVQQLVEQIMMNTARDWGVFAPIPEAASSPTDKATPKVLAEKSIEKKVVIPDDGGDGGWRWLTGDGNR